MYKQLETINCDPSCLRMIAKHYGKTFSLKTLREQSFITRESFSMLGISDAAESIGFRTLEVMLTFEQLLNETPLPCIVHWKSNHFVVIYKITSKKSSFALRKVDNGVRCYFTDPALGLVKYTSEEFKKAWINVIKDKVEKGNCLLLEPTPEFYKMEDEATNQPIILVFLKD